MDSKTKDNKPEKLVSSLVNGLSILRLLVKSKEPLGVTFIARTLGLNTSTCYNLLKTLVYEGLVVFDNTTKTYSLGFGLLTFARGSVGRIKYISLIRPHLEQIASKYNVTCTLWHVVEKNRVVLIDRADNDAAVRVHMSIGQRLPMFIAALGRCMAASLDISKADLQTQFEKLRWQSNISFEEYYQQIEEVKKQGYAIDYGQYVKGITTVSSAIHDSLNQPIMAISAVSFFDQMNKSQIHKLGEYLLEQSRQVSQILAEYKISSYDFQ